MPYVIFFVEYHRASASGSAQSTLVNGKEAKERLLQTTINAVFGHLAGKEYAKVKCYEKLLYPFLAKTTYLDPCDVLVALEKLDGRTIADRESLAGRRHAAVGFSRLEIICDDEVTAHVLDAYLLDRFDLRIMRVDDGP